MFADHWIVFFHLQLFRRSPLVLGGGVEMPGARSGYQFNLVAHDEYSSEFFASDAQFSEYCVNPFLIDNAHTVRRHAQLYKTPFTFDPKAMLVQIRQKPAAGLVIGMGYIVSGSRAFTRYLTHSGHLISLQPA